MTRTTPDPKQPRAARSDRLNALIFTAVTCTVLTGGYLAAQHYGTHRPAGGPQEADAVLNLLRKASAPGATCSVSVNSQDHLLLWTGRTVTVSVNGQHIGTTDVNPSVRQVRCDSTPGRAGVSIVEEDSDHPGPPDRTYTAGRGVPETRDDAAALLTTRTVLHALSAMTDDTPLGGQCSLSPDGRTVTVHSKLDSHAVPVTTTRPAIAVTCVTERRKASAAIVTQLKYRERGTVNDTNATGEQ